mgnify:CR=1 FL=1
MFDAAIESKDLAYTEGKKTKTVSLLEFVESMNNGGKDYARLLPILDQHPELLKDLDVDWLMSAANNGAKEVKHQLFMGGAGTSTQMHCAIGSNLFIQIHGRKQWWIYSNKNSPLLEPVVDRSVFFRSQANGEKPEGNFKKADGWTVILEPGDVLLGIPSNGLHTNGYSFARKLFFDIGDFDVSDHPEELQESVGNTLLKPHINYTRHVLDTLDAGIDLKGIVHITGGDLLENIPRVLPKDLGVEIDKDSWPSLSVFDLMQSIGGVEETDMFGSFNIGF